MKAITAKTPPMGWNSWDCYGAAVTEADLIANAEYMQEHLLAYGWEYITCDIQWYEPQALGNVYTPFAELCMDEFSRLMPAVNRFPSAADGSGFKHIADKIHSMGLKFGIHIMRGIPRQAVHRGGKIKGRPELCAADIADGTSICMWNTDMYGVKADCDGAYAYYRSLFELYAEWGVDLVKCDDIANTRFDKDRPYAAAGEIELIRRAIEECGRPMVLSLSPGPAPIEAAEHLKQFADMWRLTDDMWDDWALVRDMFSRCRLWQGRSALSAWCDCDMLPLGRLTKRAAYCGEKDRSCRLSRDEQRTLMTLWCIFRSPLIMGGELTECDDFTLSLLTNTELLNMQKYGSEPREIFYDGELSVWQSECEGGIYLAMFNLGENLLNTELLPEFTRQKSPLAVYDIWQRGSADTEAIGLSPHGCIALKIEL